MKVYVHLTPADEYNLGDQSVTTNKEDFLEMLRSNDERLAALDDDQLMARYTDYTDNQAFECELNGSNDHTGAVTILIRQEHEGVLVYANPGLLPKLIDSDELHTVWLTH